MSSRRLTNVMREQYLKRVIEDMPKASNELKYNLEDLYWKFILRHAAMGEKLKSFELIHSQLIADRTGDGGRQMRRHPYCEYQFIPNVAEPPSTGTTSYGIYCSYYGPSLSHGRLSIPISKEEETEIDDLKNQFSMEEARITEFAHMVRKKMYSVTTTSKLSEILPDFARYIPT